MKTTDAQEKSRVAFDKQACTYDTSSKGAHARRLYPFILAELSSASGVSILDLGCGTGALTQLVARKHPDCHLVGIDISSNMVTQARKNLGSHIEVIEANSNSLPFPNETFNIVYCNDSFHHYPDPYQVIDEVWRVLQRGGVFVIGECALPALARFIMNTTIRHSPEGDVRIYSSKEFRRMLQTRFCSIAYKRIESSSCVITAVKKGDMLA